MSVSKNKNIASGPTPNACTVPIKRSKLSREGSFTPSELIVCKLDTCGICLEKKSNITKITCGIRISYHESFSEIRGKSEAYINLAKLWHLNKNEIWRIDPNTFLHQAFICAQKIPASREMWKSLKCFRDSFICSRNMAARRNELILYGMSRSDAEDFLRWVSCKPIYERFPDVPLSIFGRTQQFTEIEDKELLKFLSEQNALFLNDDEIDWYQARNNKLKGFHPEILRGRYKSKFYNDVVAWKHKIDTSEAKDIFDGLVPPLILQSQKILYRKRNIILSKICSIQFPVNCALSALKCQLFTKTLDFLPWICASVKVGWGNRVILFRSFVKEYLETANPVKYTECLKFSSLSDDLLTTHVTGHPNIVADLEKITLSLIMQESVSDKPLDLPLLGSSTFLTICKKSLSNILPVAEGKACEITTLTAVDAIVFQVLKTYENSISGRKRLLLYSDLHRLSDAKPIRGEKLTDQAITDLLLSYDSDGSELLEEQTSDNENTETDTPIPVHGPSFSDLFCLRALSEAEWNQIIQSACMFTKLNGLRDVVLWERILKIAKIRTTKSAEEIQKDFFSNIYPSLELYSDEITRKELRSKME